MITRTPYIDEYLNADFVEIKSDQDVMIFYEGSYYDAISVSVECYPDVIETDIPIGSPIPNETAAYAEAGRILMGVDS